MLKIILSVIAAIVLLVIAVKVFTSIISLVFYGLALLLVGYVVWYFLSGSKRGR
ncbi:hypothetical protein [Parasphingopyxis lamellibrachiae]|uniref:Uncharacterized protein n=1 Tax=Parasphingopyxis lamellibrachiae TaxID=680125 RepID=A0A3D9FHZ0_9SPHN|nr:hypothetical protein [Parasphingopyxis lamellibrachiae]RED17395.1 hypothetical protein DFR46_2442 [Parasphingopyxis lamellibrachiae]